MKIRSSVKVRIERQAHREAVHRLHEAMKKAQQAGQKYEEAQAENKIQEEDNADPSGSICPSIDFTARAGSHDRQSGGGD
jgi:hypothetical protein